MPPVALLLWVTNVGLETTGHLCFKAAAAGGARWRAMARSPLLWCGIACFALEFVAWFALLTMIPLSQAMLINSINIVVIMVAGRLLFNERLDAVRVAGAALVSIGVALAGGAA